MINNSTTVEQYGPVVSTVFALAFNDEGVDPDLQA